MPQKHRWMVILGASICFYLSYDVRYFLFLLFIALSTFLGARFGRNKRRNRENLWICILANVGIWFAIKGLPWVGNYLNAVLEKFPGDFRISIPVFMVPIGISYYVLLAISYVVDVYKKKIEPERNFCKYLLYLSYFPAVVQGPISKYGQIRTQLTAGKRVNYDEVRKSLLLIMLGLIKKMVIADRIAIFANYCFGNYSELKGVILYLGAISYSIQLYMDFSGCVDICRGVSAMFGIDLIDNFNGPYFAKSIKEFWSRWHISLSTWLKDYIYIPLGGNRKGKLRKHINLLVTFFVSGVWHGSGLNYIVWGLLQAVYQIVGEYTYNVRKRINECLGIRLNSFSSNVYRTIITFNLTTFSWIFFRSGRLLNAIQYIKQMFAGVEVWKIFDGTLFVEGLNVSQFSIVILNIIFIAVIEYLKVKRELCIMDTIFKTHVIVRWSIYMLLIFDVILFGVYGHGYDMTGFLYGGF